VPIALMTKEVVMVVMKIELDFRIKPLFKNWFGQIVINQKLVRIISVLLLSYFVSVERH